VKLARFTVTFVLTVALGAAALAASLALVVPAAGTLSSAVSVEAAKITLKSLDQRSYVYDRNGKLMTTLFKVDRAPVKLSAVPK